jgi:hypothetical protein
MNNPEPPEDEGNRALENMVIFGFFVELVSRIQSSPDRAARSVANFGFERTLVNL